MLTCSCRLSMSRTASSRVLACILTLFTWRMRSPSCSCMAAGIPGATAATKIPVLLPPETRMPTPPTFLKEMTRGSILTGRNPPPYHCLSLERWRLMATSLSSYPRV
ncbi:hypothetical protein NP493_23g03017 [Ridgeia piscesae]|uniref:Uncharacterized protein n=1 Tax=Ridgeia piscesae TaxID=27915 RepID=A0AAD9PDR6_RIDPI|nr:hypothetical protein NP493_23g03017 [Ridgeia piscesae]